MITSLAIENYKTFKEKQTFEFVVPNGHSGSGLNVIVGANNAGKSTALSSISLLAMSQQNQVNIESDDLWDGIPANLYISGQNNGVGWIGQLARTQGSRYQTQCNANLMQQFANIQSRRAWSDRVDEQGVDSSNYENHMFSHGFNNRYFNDVFLAGALREIESKPAEKARFNSALTEIVPKINSWTVRNSHGTDFLQIQSSSGAWHRIGSSGDGILNVFKLVSSVLFSAHRETIVFDEPELSLHPQAQRRLASFLSKASANKQIILASHSPHTFHWGDIFNGARIFKVEQHIGLGSSVRTLKEESASAIKSIVQGDRKNRRLYDAIAKEMFFSDGIIFVEGIEDVHIIQNYILENGKTELEFFGYGCGGASQILTWLNAASDLNLKSVAFFDLDGAGKTAFNLAREQHGKNQSILLRHIPAEDIRDKVNTKPDGEKENSKSGVFDESWNIKKEFKAQFDELLSEASEFLNS
jgi:predicted ATP-dependent endonuclease of OLD family